MHDIKWIRAEPKAFDAAMQRRAAGVTAQQVLALDASHRGDITQLQALQEESNRLAREIGQLMGQGKKEQAQPLLARSKEVKETLARLKQSQEQQPANTELETLLAGVPNRLDDSVPEGKDETANVELRKVGTPRRFDFTPKAHDELGEALGLMDFTLAANMAGARFSVLRADLARLERALANFMIDIHTTEYGFTEVSGPYLVRQEALYGTGQLPKFASDLFKTTDGRYLIPTSEVMLANLVREQILPEELLPLRFTAYTPCFRSEAGSAGKDTRGMIRQHQFSKVELVSITTPEQEEAEHERITAQAETVLQRLKLPYRVIVLCVGDTGFSARKTYDIEVWLPSQDTYREISSCSRCGDFQARRMQARFKRGKENHFVHTLNGSGVAVGRALVAVLENYQNADGSISIPDVLQPYMSGQKIITAT